jgi:hypothetical protein
LKRFLHQWVESLNVSAGRDLGNNAAEAFVQVNLGRDQVRSDVDAVFDYSDGRLIARGLYPQG